MPETISKVLTRRLLRSNRFRSQLWDLHTLSGMESLFLDPLGNERIRMPRKQILSLHRLANAHSEWEEPLRVQRQRALTSATPSALPAPWYELSTELSIEGETVGFLVLTACRDGQSDLSALRTLWMDAARRGSDLPWAELKAAWEELPLMQRERREAWERNLRLQGSEALRLLEDPRSSLPISDALPPMIRKCCGLIQEQYMEPVTLREIAGECGISAEHLSRRFHECTGLRFSEYLAETRVNATKQALKESTDPISEIAGRCGFSTLSRFNRCFRELTGTTPREFRKRGIAL